MRNPITKHIVNTESLEMYAEIVKILGEHSDMYNLEEKIHTWSLNDNYYITLQTVDDEKYPVVTIEDACSEFDKLYQIIGYAHYREYKVICNF